MGAPQALGTDNLTLVFRSLAMGFWVAVLMSMSLRCTERKYCSRLVRRWRRTTQARLATATLWCWNRHSELWAAVRLANVDPSFRDYLLYISGASIGLKCANNRDRDADLNRNTNGLRTLLRYCASRAFSDPAESEGLNEAAAAA